jgi:uncharacterized membrane protein YgdD (TMEM256/DUF423 family)
MKPHRPTSWLKYIAIFFGTSAIALGAFGAHALKSSLLQNQTLETWKTASLYHLTHSLLLLLIATVLPTKKLSFTILSVGILLFSGSLYLLALYPFPWLGPITPLGGLALILGWLSLLRSPQPQNDLPK